jgi:hypothetical protein
MSEGMPASTPEAGDSGASVLATGGDALPNDVTAVLAQLRETIGNLDALLASVNDVEDLPDES